MGCFPFFVFLFTNGNWETGRFSFLFFSFQNENPLAAKYTDPKATVPSTGSQDEVAGRACVRIHPSSSGQPAGFLCGVDSSKKKVDMNIGQFIYGRFLANAIA